MASIVTKLIKKNNYVQIFTDDAYLCSVNEACIAKERIYIGKDLDISLESRLKDEGSISKIEGKALQLINSKLYSESELRKKLHEFALKYNITHDIESVNAVIHKLIDLGLFNEKQNAENIIINYKNRKKGRRYIEHKLAEKTYPKTLIKDLFAAFQDNTDGLKEVLEKKYKSLIKSEENTRKIEDKLTRFALGRGFEYRNIRDALRSILRHT